MSEPAVLALMERMANALERLSPRVSGDYEIGGSDAFVFEPDYKRLRPVSRIAAVPLSLLQGIDRACDQLLENTLRFSRSLPANNALLWGARGMGKSSLVKAVHAEVNRLTPGSLALVEIHREDIDRLPELLSHLGSSTRQCLLFCDDLSFDSGETSYKSLKAVLEGGLEGRPDNVLFYATSNRRHLMPRQMIDNERKTAINPGEAVEEKVSLSDRFGLWLGFHACDQATYLTMVEAYVSHFGLEHPHNLDKIALEWSTTRGNRSGRVAWQFVQDLAGQQERRLSI